LQFIKSKRRVKNVYLTYEEERKLRKSTRRFQEYRDEATRTSRLRLFPTWRDRRELFEAYADSENVADIRLGHGISFYSDVLYDAAALMAIVPQVIPEGYNEFDPHLAVKGLVAEYDGVDVRYQPAREGSVCMYVHSMTDTPLRLPGPVTIDVLKIDEWSFINDTQTVVRLWWD